MLLTTAVCIFMNEYAMRRDMSRLYKISGFIRVLHLPQICSNTGIFHNET